MMDSKEKNAALDVLEKDIRNLQVEFARYFAGDRDRPPLERRDELGLRIRQLRSRQGTSTADTYRLTALTARLHSLNELADRKLRKHHTRIQQRTKATDAVVAGGERGQKAMRRLFLELYGSDKTSKSMRGFGEFLERKVTEIRTRTGCSSVQFRVIESKGKRSLKAKPLGRLQSKTSTGQS